MNESPYRRHAWILLLSTAVPMVLIAAVQLVSETPLAPGLGFGGITTLAEMKQLFTLMNPKESIMVIGMMRMWAASLLLFFVLFSAVVLKVYRKGERWAWYAAWTNPAIVVTYIIIATLYDGWGSTSFFWIIGAGGGVYFLLILLALLLPYRRFFPKQAKAVSPHSAGSTFQRNAWILLLVGTLPLVGVGIPQLISETPLSAGLGFGGIDTLSGMRELMATMPSEAAGMVMGFLRLFASTVAIFSVLFAALVVNACRRGERWAWYSAWTFPAFTVVYATIGAVFDGWGNFFLLYVVVPGETILLILSLALFLYYRRFFQTRGSLNPNDAHSAAVMQ